jgi:hypothetical protein
MIKGIYCNLEVGTIYFYYNLNLGIGTWVTWFIFKENFSNKRIYSYLKVNNKYFNKLGI